MSGDRTSFSSRGKTPTGVGSSEKEAQRSDLPMFEPEWLSRKSNNDAARGTSPPSAEGRREQQQAPRGLTYQYSREQMLDLWKPSDLKHLLDVQEHDPSNFLFLSQEALLPVNHLPPERQEEVKFLNKPRNYQSSRPPNALSGGMDSRPFSSNRGRGGSTNIRGRGRSDGSFYNNPRESREPREPRDQRWSAERPYGDRSQQSNYSQRRRFTSSEGAPWKNENSHDPSERGHQQNPRYMWLYEDPSGEVQGPFTDNEMQLWYEDGYFTDSLVLKRVYQKEFVTLGMLLSKDGSSPFINTSSGSHAPPPAYSDRYQRSSGDEEKRFTREQRPQPQVENEERRYNRDHGSWRSRSLPPEERDNQKTASPIKPHERPESRAPPAKTSSNQNLDLEEEDDLLLSEKFGLPRRNEAQRGPTPPNLPGNAPLSREPLNAMDREETEDENPFLQSPLKRSTGEGSSWSSGTSVWNTPRSSENKASTFSSSSKEPVGVSKEATPFAHPVPGGTTAQPALSGSSSPFLFSTSSSGSFQNDLGSTSVEHFSPLVPPSLQQAPIRPSSNSQLPPPQHLPSELPLKRKEGVFVVDEMGGFVKVQGQPPEHDTPAVHPPNLSYNQDQQQPPRFWGPSQIPPAHLQGTPAYPPPGLDNAQFFQYQQMVQFQHQQQQFVQQFGAPPQFQQHFHPSQFPPQQPPHFQSAPFPHPYQQQYAQVPQPYQPPFQQPPYQPLHQAQLPAEMAPSPMWGVAPPVALQDAPDEYQEQEQEIDASTIQGSESHAEEPLLVASPPLSQNKEDSHSPIQQQVPEQPREVAQKPSAKPTSKKNRSSSQGKTPQAAPPVATQPQAHLAEQLLTSEEKRESFQWKRTTKETLSLREIQEQELQERLKQSKEVKPEPPRQTQTWSKWNAPPEPVKIAAFKDIQQQQQLRKSEVSSAPTTPKQSTEKDPSSWPKATSQAATATPVHSRTPSGSDVPAWGKPIKAPAPAVQAPVRTSEDEFPKLGGKKQGRQGSAPQTPTLSSASPKTSTANDAPKKKKAEETSGAPVSAKKAATPSSQQTSSPSQPAVEGKKKKRGGKKVNPSELGFTSLRSGAELTADE